MQADGFARVGLDEHRVAVMHGFAHAGGGHADPVLIALDFFWYADLHSTLPIRVRPLITS